MADDLKDVIKDAAEGPESAEVDGVRTKQHSLDDLIKADKHLASRGVSRNPASALSRVKLILSDTGQHGWRPERKINFSPARRRRQ